MAGRLERIWRKRCRRGPMDPLSRVELRAGAGLVDDAKRSRTRQVTIVSRERWKAGCGSAGPARRSGAATSESPHLGSRSGEQPREYAAGRVGSSARQRRNAPGRAAGRTACPACARSGVTDGAAGSTPRSSRTGRVRSGIPSRGSARHPGSPSRHCVVGVRLRGDRRAGSRGLRPRSLHRPLPRAHPHTQVPGSGLSRGSLPGHASRGCLHGAPPRAPRRPPRGPRVRSPSDLLADAARPPDRPNSLSSVASERSRIPRRPRCLRNGWALSSATSSMTV